MLVVKEKHSRLFLTISQRSFDGSFWLGLAYLDATQCGPNIWATGVYSAQIYVSGLLEYSF